MRTFEELRALIEQVRRDATYPLARTQVDLSDMPELFVVLYDELVRVRNRVAELERTMSDTAREVAWEVVNIAQDRQEGLARSQALEDDERGGG